MAGLPGYVIRAVVFDYNSIGEACIDVKAPGLSRWLTNIKADQGARIRHRILKISKVGFLVQQLPERRTGIVWRPRIRLTRIGHMVCRYHEGPPGRPEEQEYCIYPALEPSGFCREHARSALALFERCAAGSMHACELVDRVWTSEEYVVYLLDYGGSRAKVGLTRGWRVLWRAAEQPHIALAVVAKFKGRLVEARSLERRLGALRGISEGMGVKISERVDYAARILPALDAVKAASRIAEKITELGLRGSFDSYTILPVTRTEYFLKASRGNLSRILGEEVEVIDYWAGMLLVRTSKGLATIDKKLILHRLLYAEFE